MDDLPNLASSSSLSSVALPSTLAMLTGIPKVAIININWLYVMTIRNSIITRVGRGVT